MNAAATPGAREHAGAVLMPNDRQNLTNERAYGMADEVKYRYARAEQAKFSRGAISPNNQERETMNLRKLIAVTVASLAMLFQQAAQASYSCSGRISDLAVENTTGDVIVSVGPMLYQRICNLNLTQNGVNPTMCKAYLGQMMVAQVAEKIVILSSTGTISSCAAAPQWAYMSGFYFLSVQTN